MKSKHDALGMNHSTAQNRLVKDLVFKFVVMGGYKCYHCNQDMTRENFSIEHKVSWLHSPDPKKFFFDLDNVSFSHLRCNLLASHAARPKMPKEVRIRNRDVYRRNYYLKTGE